MPNNYKIDPRNLSLESVENKILYHFFINNPDKQFFEKNIQYDVQIKGITYSFELTHDILPRKRESNPDELRYEILAQKVVGEGGMATIFFIECTLYVTLDKRLICKNKNRVDKKQKIDTTKPLDDAIMAIQEEYEKCRLTNPSLGAKSPILVDGYTHTIMHRLQGGDLVDMFNRGHVNTIDRLLNISIALIHACQEQAHDNGIIHRDINPGNIFVNPITEEVTLIDFGLSAKKGEYKKGGTPGYIRPIDLSNPADESCDIYAIGVVLGQIWGSHQISNNMLIELQPYYSSVYRYYSPQQRDLLMHVIKNILLEPKGKISLTAALYYLEIFRIIYYNPNEISLLDEVVKKGIQVRENYREAVRTKQTHEDLKNVFFNGLKQINTMIVDKDKEGLVVGLFVRVLGINAFKNLYTVDQVEEKIKLIAENYTQHLQKLNAQLSELENIKFEPELNQHVTFLQNDIKRILKKENKYNISNIDTMVFLNKKYANHEKYFQEKIEKLKAVNASILTVRENDNKPVADAEVDLKLINSELMRLPYELVGIKFFAKRAAHILNKPEIKKIRSIENLRKEIAEIQAVRNKI